MRPSPPLSSFAFPASPFLFCLVRFVPFVRLVWVLLLGCCFSCLVGSLVVPSASFDSLPCPHLGTRRLELRVDCEILLISLCDWWLRLFGLRDTDTSVFTCVTKDGTYLLVPPRARLFTFPSPFAWSSCERVISWLFGIRSFSLSLFGVSPCPVAVHGWSGLTERGGR